MSDATANNSGTRRANVLHVICVSDFYGTQRSVLSTARSVDPGRFRCMVAAPFGEAFFSELERAGIPAFEVPMRNLSDVGSMRNLASIIRKESVDIVHCHLGISTFLGLLAARLAGCRRRVVTRHFIRDRYTTVNPAVYPLYLSIYRWMGREADVTICVSGAVRKAVAARERIPEQRCVVVPNGIRLPGTGAGREEARRSVREEFGLPADAGLVVTLSRLAPEKGLETLVDAAARCAYRVPGASFIVAGEGELEETLRKRAAKLGIGGRFIFAGFRDDAQRLLAAADLYVLPGPNESFGVSLLEAMALGVPSIAMRAGGPAEIIENGKNGFLVFPRNTTELAEKVVSLLTDAELAMEIGWRGAERARDFEEKAVAAKIEKIYAGPMEKKK
ncbi:MAG: glycosyltransferase [bacterium]